MSFATSSVFAAPATIETGFELPVFDVAAFEKTAAFLAPETLAKYLSEIVERAEGVLRRLPLSRAVDEGARELARQAHTLAGGVGLFGFTRLAAQARGLEHAIETNAPEIPAIADRLAITIEVSRPVMQRHIPANARD